MADEKRTVELSDFEHRLLVGVLADNRNYLIDNKKSTDDVNDIIKKVIKAPIKRSFFRSDHEAR